MDPDPLSSPEILITLSGILVILKVVSCFTNVGQVDGCRSIFKMWNSTTLNSMNFIKLILFM